MRRPFKISFIVLLAGLGLNASAQKAAKNTNKKVVQSVALPVQTSPKRVWAYLGQSDFNNGLIPKVKFDELLKQGLTAKDSIGRMYKVDGFTFSYAARNLYEDSVGKLIVLTDFFSEPCLGDTISPGIKVNVYQYGLTKPGDTAYFDGIKVIKPEGGHWTAPPMKFVITK
jgi:hypothetical protein